MPRKIRGDAALKEDVIKPWPRAAARGFCHRHISVAGGANVIQQYLKAGLIDELQVHIAPLLLGDGARLLDNLGTESPKLKATRVIESPAVTHLRYSVVK